MPIFSSHLRTGMVQDNSCLIIFLNLLLGTRAKGSFFEFPAKTGKIAKNNTSEASISRVHAEDSTYICTYVDVTQFKKIIKQLLSCTIPVRKWEECRIYICT
jgi:hypothetical protein